MGQAKRRGTYEERKAAAIHDIELTLNILKKQKEEFIRKAKENDSKKNKQSI